MDFYSCDINKTVTMRASQRAGSNQSMTNTFK